MKSSVITLKGVTKSFGAVKAVDNVSLSVQRGEVIGFVGANGAGKTTTISLILGFIHPTTGMISLFGAPVTPARAAKSHARVGYASGDMELPLQMTGAQYLSFVAAQYKDTKPRLQELSKRFSPQLDKKIATLSRGNKQKIALIAAFISNPELVVLDEPTTGLDPMMQEAFLQLIHEERQKGTTVFMSSHLLNEVADVCDRVILMKDGRVVQDVSASMLVSNSGKQVKIVTGYSATLPPKGAEHVKKFKDENGKTVLEFAWKAEPRELQHWLAGIKQLVDLQVTEYDLEEAFRNLYNAKEPTI